MLQKNPHEFYIVSDANKKITSMIRKLKVEEILCEDNEVKAMKPILTTHPHSLY